jgi:hypothetical protein
MLAPTNLSRSHHGEIAGVCSRIAPDDLRSDQIHDAKSSLEEQPFGLIGVAHGKLLPRTDEIANTKLVIG